MNVNETEIGCFMIFFFSFFTSFLSFFLSFSFFFSRVNILNCWRARYIMAAMLVAKNQLARNKTSLFTGNQAAFENRYRIFELPLLSRNNVKSSC